MPIAPTLILGLGGTGSQIVERVQQKVRESDSSQSERIAFVVFDTDINDLGQIKRRSPEIYTVQTSTRNTVGEYLSINTNARDNWFPVNEMMNRKTLTEGAAQVRAISRLAFDTTLKGGNLRPLHDAIDQLFRIDKDQEEQSLRVIVASSLAGGTGSGLLLSVSMYLANYLKAKFPKAKAITRGFFIQPDVFYKVIPGSEEQQNLQVNAYAAVRELDAFLMKGDNTLPEQYKNLKFEFPRVGGEGVEIISAMPYDFCFLFDAKNKEGGSLATFDSYLDHAATCIYTQSIGPMSKKSNSREDNVLREVIKNDGRNRYAGAGASRLVYPWQHIRDVVGFQWAQQTLSVQWMQFDNVFKNEQIALLKQRERGYRARDLDRAATFIQAVDNAERSKEPFAKAMLTQCQTFDSEGLEVVGTQWESYIDALREHIAGSGIDPKNEGEAFALRSRIASLYETVEGDEYSSLFYDLERHNLKVVRSAEEAASILGYTLFKSDFVDVTRAKDTHILETYLRERVTGKFVHPVSARYFLYRTSKLLMEEKMRVENEIEQNKSYFDSFAKNYFDDPDTEEIETPDMFATRKKSLKERVTRKPSVEKQDLANAFSTYLGRVDNYRQQKIYQAVLADAIEYVDGMARSFETFFTSLENNLKRLKTRIEQARVKYDGLQGSTTRYVLASSECIDSLSDSMPYMGGISSIDSELSENIYNRVRDYYMLTDEKHEGYFADLYNNTILGYFADQVMVSHGEEIKMDIIEALERECRTLHGDFEESNVVHYVRDEVNKAKRLASPFIEQPLGEERHPIESCAFNPLIEGDSDPKRKALISELLGDYGGERDKEISPQEVLFYNAIYGIRASDLSKFAPARQSITERRGSGEYFRAYHNLVSEITPSIGETKVITPHIDRRWHSISELPDLDDSYQAEQLFLINSALLYGLAFGRLEWSDGANSKEKVYRYLPLRGLPEDFVVSNGTPCDRFYEVVDALTINMTAVREILQATEREKVKELERQKVEFFATTKFAKTLAEGIEIEQLRDEFAGFEDAQLSVFDIVAFVLLSMPAELHYDSQTYAMASNFLTCIRVEVEAVSEAEEVLAILEGVYMNQLEFFSRNIAAYHDVAGKSFLRKLRTVLRSLIELADELGMEDLLERARVLDKVLRRAG